jgi:hypothetical protein
MRLTEWVGLYLASVGASAVMLSLAERRWWVRMTFEGFVSVSMLLLLPGVNVLGTANLLMDRYGRRAHPVRRFRRHKRWERRVSLAFGLVLLACGVMFTFTTPWRTQVWLFGVTSIMAGAWLTYRAYRGKL